MSLVRHALFGAAAIATATFASTAYAAENPCGNIELLAIGECHFEFSGGCKAKCEPLNFVASCDGECNADISVECKGSCSTDCSAECEVDPGSFECQGSCESSCQAQIALDCKGDEDEAGCIAYCNSMCESDCQGQCAGTPPTADCNAKCDASCSGSCETTSNFDCSLNCSAEIQGGCETSCDAPEGALFCDGQFIAVTDLPACVAHIVDNFKIELEFEASASASVKGCSAGAASPSKGGFGALAGLAGLMLLARRRRS